MERWIVSLAHLGYPLLFVAVLLEAIGIPIPAAIALLIFGAAAARGSLYLPAVLGTALGAMLTGDILLFLLGRHTGWWLLGLLCRLSLNPESCILRAADAFHRRGRTLLVFAKFLPGINSMAAPLSGSMNMRFTQFIRLDIVGAALYICAYLFAGYLGADVLGALTQSYRAFGNAVAAILATALLAYIGVQIWLWQKSRAWRSVPFVLPDDAARAVSDGMGIIYDVRSHGYYDRNAVRIRGSVRVDPDSIHRFHQENIPEGKQAFLYCT
jgi:membrane protein DedA with SNARE-associated domain